MLYIYIFNATRIIITRTFVLFPSCVHFTSNIGENLRCPIIHIVIFFVHTVRCDALYACSMHPRCVTMSYRSPAGDHGERAEAAELGGEKTAAIVLSLCTREYCNSGSCVSRAGCFVASNLGLCAHKILERQKKLEDACTMKECDADRRTVFSR